MIKTCCCEDFPCCGHAEAELETELAHEAIAERFDAEPYDGGGWPGSGDGSDDLADYNANEADDYRNEGECDTPFGEALDGG